MTLEKVALYGEAIASSPLRQLPFAVLVRTDAGTSTTLARQAAILIAPMMKHMFCVAEAGLESVSGRACPAQTVVGTRLILDTPVPAREDSLPRKRPVRAGCPGRRTDTQTASFARSGTTKQSR